jgi:hypothetical protein
LDATARNSIGCSHQSSIDYLLSFPVLIAGFSFFFLYSFGGWRRVTSFIHSSIERKNIPFHYHGSKIGDGKIPTSSHSLDGAITQSLDDDSGLYGGRGKRF